MCQAPRPCCHQHVRPSLCVSGLCSFGRWVTISGSATPLLKCLFAPCASATAFAVRCVSPANPAGSYALSVSTNAQDPALVSLPYTYVGACCRLVCSSAFVLLMCDSQARCW